MHLFNRRAGDGTENGDLGFDPLALEGDLREPAPDEGPALVPLTADFPPTWAALPALGQGVPAHVAVLARVRDLEGLGRRLDAILMLRQSLGDAQVDVPLRLRLAGLLEANGDAGAALDALDDGLRATGRDASLLVQRGALLGRMGRLAQSEQDLRNALAITPDSIEAELHLGVSLSRRGRHSDALRMLERARARDPARADVAFHLGEALLHAGQPERALPNLMRATELDPGDPRAYKLLGRLLDRLGRTEEAMVMHRKAREAGH